ncbi:MAG: ABC transporter permease [Lewinellaceae bacterium]|nr:ABC transporter permease [Lewinella sp.]MCB9282336.1 ABC transporter permease [Lewinellaceae bacterium]
MWINFLKIAFRNLLKNKSFSLINIFGLTMGTACCLYILFYVRDQRSYDLQHHDAEDLFRVITDLELPGEETMHMATSGPPITPAIKAEFPEVEEAARVCSPPGVAQNLFRVGDKVFYEKKGFLADSTFFRMFDYQFIAGDPIHALDNPFTVVISENLAQKLFNTSDPVGQTVGIGGTGNEDKFQVTGVFTHALGKSHLMPEFFMSMNSGDLGQYIRSNDSWAGNNFVHGYIRLKKGADPKVLEAKLPEFLLRNGADQLRQLNMGKTLHLQPVSEIHTTPGLTAESSKVTGNRFLNILLLIAGFIQLVACINFMNLSTARSSRRAREVGVRKAIGAQRWALIGQFLGESMLLAAAAVVLAAPVIYFCLPFLNRLTGVELSIHLTESPMIWLTTFGLVLLTGLAAGSYPAFYLSSFKPIQVLRGGGSNIFGGIKGNIAGLLRKGLVVSQFVIAVSLIIGSMIIRNQLDFMLEKDLGFEKNQKVIFPFHSTEGQQKLEAFRNELQNLPEVQAASGMAVVPGQSVYNDIPLFKEGQNMDVATDIRFTYVDENYLNTLKIKLLSGRFMMPSDTSTREGEGKIVINETALKELDIPLEEAPGKILRSEFGHMNFKITVVGVMQDFNFEGLGEKIDAFGVLIDPPSELSNVVADIHTSDYPAFFAKAEAAWKSVLPNLPFEYSFLDEDFAKLYESEQSLSRIISVFTFMAILISCLGLFGLSAFTAEQRTKEIGIRKVLGATVAGLVGLLSRDFLKLVVFSLLIAAPLAWFLMGKWLNTFAYRAPVYWWIFAIAGAVTVGVAFLTVSFQSIKAALANPVESLKSE